MAFQYLLLLSSAKRHLLPRGTISPNALVGPRNITVTNPGGRSSTATLFTVSSDQTPTVAINNLSDQQSISGIVTVSATAIDDIGIQRVEFYVDGTLSATDNNFPYQFIWDTTVIPAGIHAFSVKAYDNTNQSANAQISVNVTLTTLSFGSVTPPAGRVTGGQGIRLAGSFAGLSTVTVGGAQPHGVTATAQAR